MLGQLVKVGDTYLVYRLFFSGIFLIIFGVIILSIIGYLIQKKNNIIKNWIKIETPVITNTRIVTKIHSKSSNKYQLQLRFSYTIDNKKYQSIHKPTFKHKKEAESYIDKFKSLDVYANPINYNDVYILDLSNDRNINIIGIIIGLIMCIMGTFLIMCRNTAFCKFFAFMDVID